MRALALATILALAGCGGSAAVDCAAPEVVLAEGQGYALTCGDAEAVETWIEVLATRNVDRGDRAQLQTALVARYREDAATVKAQLDAVRAESAALLAEDLVGLAAAERHAEAVYRVGTGEAPFSTGGDGLSGLVKAKVAVWATDDATKLGLSEVAVEGWIFYASLCREVQGAGPLRVSVSDRVQVYDAVKSRFAGGDRSTQIALAGLGPFWSTVKQRWQAASYDQQQGWILAAPLPPPMTASSLGYFEAVLEQDVSRGVALLHERFGPLPLSRDGE